MTDPQSREAVREGDPAHGPAGDVPPGYFRAAAGNLVREDDPLAVAFRKFASLCAALAPVLPDREE